MPEEQCEALANIIKNEDLKSYSKHGKQCITSLMKAVILGDRTAVFQAGYDMAQIFIHTPTLIFWSKAERFLRKAFDSYDDQIKFAAKFNKDNRDYIQNVKKVIYLIDEIDEDEKIDYFATLTRAFSLTDLERDLYFKLAKIITMCTSFELEYLEKLSDDFESENNIWIFSLQLYGLFAPKENDRKIYVLSDFGKALKQKSLNFENGLNGKQSFSEYKQLQPPQNPIPRWDDFKTELKIEEI